VTTSAVALPDGSFDVTLDGVDVIANFVPGPKAVPSEEIAMLDAYDRERVADGQRRKAAATASLATAPMPDIPPEIAEPIRQALRDLVNGNYNSVTEAGPGTLSAQEVGALLEEFGGDWVLAPQVVPPDTTVIYSKDSQDRLMVECSLWTIAGKSDVAVLFGLARSSMSAKYKVVVNSIWRP
jgi:hypothetical protein